MGEVIRNTPYGDFTHTIIGVYTIVHNESGRTYFGSSSDVARRFRDHKCTLRGGRHVNRHLQAAWNKYGEQAFSFNLAGQCGVEARRGEEQRLIDRAHADGSLLYNMQACAETHDNFGYKHTGQAKERMRGRMCSVGTREKLRQAHLGRRHPESMRQKVRENNLRMGPPLKMLEAARIANTGRIRPQWEKDKISASMKLVRAKQREAPQHGEHSVR